MAKLVKTARVKLGRLVKVWNTQRKKFCNSKIKYFALWVEDCDGQNDRCLLFTQHELDKAEYRASRNPEDLPKKTWFKKKSSNYGKKYGSGN